MIIGVDCGYTYTKTSEGIIFPSCISTNDDILGKSDYLIVDGKKYSIGEGKLNIELNKTNTEVTKVCMLYSLAASLEYDEEFYVVTGLPIGQYKSQKDQFKEFLLSNDINIVNINGVDRTIIINDVEIFPQAAGSLYGYESDTNNVIIVDIGGRTVDICYFKTINNTRKLVNYSTILEGTISMYSDIVKSVNQRYGTNLQIEDGEQILSKGFRIYGKPVNTDFLEPILEDHVSSIVKELRLNYPIETTDMIITGGGAYLYHSRIKNVIKHADIMLNAQFSNAIGFKKVGEKIWQR